MEDNFLALIKPSKRYNSCATEEKKNAELPTLAVILAVQHLLPSKRIKTDPKNAVQHFSSRLHQIGGSERVCVPPFLNCGHFFFPFSLKRPASTRKTLKNLGQISSAACSHYIASDPARGGHVVSQKLIPSRGSPSPG